jgi:hypothetical protein
MHFMFDGEVHEDCNSYAPKTENPTACGFCLVILSKLYTIYMMLNQEKMHVIFGNLFIEIYMSFKLSLSEY